MSWLDEFLIEDEEDCEKGRWGNGDFVIAWLNQLKPQRLGGGE